MSTPFLGEIKIISWNFPPRGWAFCNGQLLPINQNQALFSLLGTTYGGDGRTTFGLPNLQGRSPVHRGNGIVQGQASGETAHTLTMAEMTQHTHTPMGTATAAGVPTPSGNFWASGGQQIYFNPPPATGAVAMAANAIGNTGGSQPHENMSPYLVLNMVIALQGIFPSQN
ncbi:MAG: phage tail protein [Pyrinomonadaceae bacterium]